MSLENVFYQMADEKAMLYLVHIIINSIQDYIEL